MDVNLAKVGQNSSWPTRNINVLLEMWDNYCDILFENGWTLLNCLLLVLIRKSVGDSKHRRKNGCSVSVCWATKNRENSFETVCFGKLRLALFFVCGGAGFECCRRAEGGCQYSLIEANCKQKKAFPQTDRSEGKPFGHINRHRQWKYHTPEYQFRSVIFLFELAILDIPPTDRPAPLSI